MTLAQAKSFANKISEAFPSGQAAVKLKQAVMKESGALLKVDLPSTQTTVLFSSIGINYKNPSFYNLLVANYLLGGSGFSSVIIQAMRENTGLVYSAQTTIKRLSLRGPFFLWFQTKSDQKDKAIQLARKTLGDFLKQGVSGKVFLQAKKTIIGSFPLQFSSNSLITDALSRIAFYHLPFSYLDDFVPNIKNVSQQDMMQSIRKLISLDSLITVEVGPNAKGK